MKLFLVHAGFYDDNVSGGFYESHTNYFVVATDVKQAKQKAKAIPEYKNKKMHIDGIKEIDIVDVFRPSKEAEGIAKDAIKKGTKVLWLQYGIHSDEAKVLADKENIQFVSNRCIKQEYQKLFQKSNPVFPVLKD